MQTGVTPAYLGRRNADPAPLMRWTTATALVILLLLSAAGIATSQLRAYTPPITDASGNVLAGSIAAMEQVRLGGVDQWLVIRGTNTANPVLLFLSGGTGGSELAMVRHKLALLESHFTIVVWEQYLIPEWANANGGLHLSSIAVFLLTVLAITIILTWVFNNTRGSLLLAMVVHSSVNASQVVVNELFPSAAGTELNALLGFGGVALVLILVTRGRLGYRSGEVALRASKTVSY